MGRKWEMTKLYTNFCAPQAAEASFSCAFSGHSYTCGNCIALVMDTIFMVSIFVMLVIGLLSVVRLSIILIAIFLCLLVAIYLPLHIIKEQASYA